MLKIIALKQKRTLFLIFISLAFLMLSNAIFELIQSKKDLYNLMENQSHTLLTSLMVASENSFQAFEYLDRLTQDIDLNNSASLRRNTGFGPLIRKVAENNDGIIYIAYQDSFDILAATGNIIELEPIIDSEFLSGCMSDSMFMTRTVDFDSLVVFEAVHFFKLNEEINGVLRMGLSTEPLKEINQRIYIRLIIISLVLLMIGFVILIFIFNQQQYSILKSNYHEVETYSGKIIDNVSDAIIVLNGKGEFQIFNNASEKLFNINKKDIETLSISDLFPENDCIKFLNNSNDINRINCVLGGELRTLLVSKSSFFDKDSNESVILVLKDMTRELLMQKKLDRQERMTAMGELAAGVAHEIRNPLNTISTIIQQLKRDFTPEEDKEEYNEFTNIVYSEVNRINNTVKDFLRFARPEPTAFSKFKLSSLLSSLKMQYQPMFLEKNISFSLNTKWDGIVIWDENQIKQVFINFIQNSYDVLPLNGSFSINVEQSKESNEILFHVIDNGSGMSEKVKANIFNLYFTTKAGGTGIGLSIVQRIIYEHGGFISVNSEEGKGTTFIIRLPISL